MGRAKNDVLRTAAIVALLILSGSAASSQDAASIVKEAYAGCTTNIMELNKKHGKSGLREADRRYCACYAGAFVALKTGGKPVPDEAAKQVVDACDGAFETGQ